MKNLQLRALTGLLFVAVIVFCTVFSPVALYFLLSAVVLLTLAEFAQLTNRHAGASVNIPLNTFAGFLLMAALCERFTGGVSLHLFVFYLLSLLCLFISELYARKPDPLRNWTCAVASHAYIVLPMALLFKMTCTFDPFQGELVHTWWFPLSIFLFLWTNDTGAYLCGSALHKRFPKKLFPRVSPNKSWVGSIGGGLLCLVTATLIWHFIPGKMLLWQWMGLAMTVCVFGTWGDLFESLLKRQLGVKDSGNILPGHGGMLDRFDSTLLAVPAATAYFYFIGLC